MVLEQPLSGTLQNKGELDQDNHVNFINLNLRLFY